MNSLRRLRKMFNVYKLPYDVKPPYTHIVQVGDPILRSVSRNVPPAEIRSIDVQEVRNMCVWVRISYVNYCWIICIFREQVIRIMLQIMKNDQLAGISAPQIGVPLRIIAMQCPMEFLLKLFSMKEIEERQMATMEPRVMH